MLKTRYFVLLFLTICLFFIIPLDILSAQTPPSEGEAFKKALRDIEAEKIKREEELLANLQAKLEVATQKWLASAKKNKGLEIDKLIEQKWEKLSKAISVVHYEYYLRDYEYSVVKNDIIKSASLIAPFQASLCVLERLYVERANPASSSYREKYLYKVEQQIEITFEYKEDKFNAINTEYAKPTIEKGWPEEVKKNILRI